MAVTLLGLPSLRDREVSELVATGVPPTGVWHAGSVEQAFAIGFTSATLAPAGA